MGWLRKFLQGTDVRINENTGALRSEDDALRGEIEKLTALIEGGRLKVDAAGVTLTVDNLEFDVSELATAAGQASILAALGKGQALAAASLPVVLPALQETALKSVTEASAADIKAAVETLATEVTVGDGLAVSQADASKLSVTEASAADIKTAVETLATEVTVGDGLAVSQADASKLSVTEASAADIKAAVQALAGAPVAGTFSKIITSADATAGAAFDIAVAGKKIALTSLVVSTAAAMTASFAEETTATLKFRAYCGTNGGAGAQWPFATPLKIDAADLDLILTTSVAGNISVTVTGYYYT